ncbi:MAG: arsenate reductase ArsC [Spirochaetaceae bacterium]|nr:arsenate reductase ArsC [Spirochaetaceae bacterium]
MDKLKVIFICIHNSARSQMAEAWLKHFGGEDFEVYSAGLEPGNLNPMVVQAMKLEDIDISGNSTNSVNEFIDGHIRFDFVITVCDESAAERCPYFPGQGKRLHWGFRDPSSLGGDSDEKLKATISIRDEIRKRIKGFLKDLD